MVCRQPHLAPPWQGADIAVARLAVRIAGNGSYQVVAICPDCDTLAGPIPRWLVERPGLGLADLPVVADYRGQLGRCSRRGCERDAVEDHHFAPRAIFEDEADDWPRALLCIEHHLEWHRRMGAA